MLDFVAMIVVSFFGLMGFVVYFYISRYPTEVGYKIVTGVVDGTPITTAQRWYMLFIVWLPHAAAVVSWAVLQAVVQIAIANYVGHASVRLIAYLSAFLAAVAALGWVLTGALDFSRYRSVLRQAQAD